MADTNKEDVPPARTSPLGMDPPVDNVDTTEDKEEPKEESKQSKDNKLSISQEEIDSLQEKAKNYDLIASDPELATTIADHFKARTGTSRKAKAKAEEPQEPRIDEATAQRIQELTRRNAQNEIALFRLQNPDMDQYKDNMATLINRYGMSLDDAYRFSKSTVAQTEQKSTKPNPARPMVETNDSAGFDQTESDLVDIERRINDPKATPRMDDAIDLAIATAFKKNK
jgi:hypothetical protein